MRKAISTYAPPYSVFFREFISSIALRQQDEDADDKEKAKKKKDVEVKEEKPQNGVGL